MSYVEILAKLAHVLAMLQAARVQTLDDEAHVLLLVRVYRDLISATNDARGFLVQYDPNDAIGTFIRDHKDVTGTGPSDAAILDFIRTELAK